MSEKIKTAYDVAVERTAHIAPAEPPKQINRTRTCLECQWLRQQDEGYSNWTVMGYQADCMFGLNSFNSEDAGHDEKSRFASACIHFNAGIKLEFDVDHESEEAAIRDWKALICKSKSSEL